MLHKTQNFAPFDPKCWYNVRKVNKDSLPYVYSVVFPVFVAFSNAWSWHARLKHKGAKFCVLWSTDHLNQAKCGYYEMQQMYGITCRAWHHDASNSSNGPPVILPFCFRRFFFFSTGFGRVFSGSRGIWLKYRAGCGKMWDLLTGYGIWLLHRGSDRDSLKSWEKTVFGKEMTEVWDLGLTWQRNGKAGLGRLRDFHGQFSSLEQGTSHIFSDETIFKNVPNESLLSPQKFISKKCWKLSSLPLKLDHCRNIFVAVVFMSSNWCSLHRSDILVRRPCATGTGQPGNHTYRDCNLRLFLQKHAKKEEGFD